MAIIAVLAGGIIGIIHGFIALAIGLSLSSAFLVWLLASSAVALLICRVLRTNADEAMRNCPVNPLREDQLALGEAETRRAALATTDGTSMSRVMRIYAERDARLASVRANRRADPWDFNN